MGVGITMENGKSGKLRRVLLIVCALMLVVWGVLIAHVILGSKEKKETETIRVLKSMKSQYRMSYREDGNFHTSEDVYRYDEKGRLINLSYYSDGVIYSSYDLEYYYDGDLPVTRMTYILYNRIGGVDEIWRKEVYEYYPSGKMRSRTQYWEYNSETYIERTFFDTNGYETGWTSYENGVVVSKGRYQRDVNGFEISCELWTPEEDEWKPVLKEKNECDSEGRVRKQYTYFDDRWWLNREIEYYDDGTWLRTDYKRSRDETDESVIHTFPFLSYLIDSEGRTLEVKQYDYWSEDEPFVDHQTTIEYAADGSYTERNIYSFGYVYTRKYDRDGRLVTQERVNSDGVIDKIIQNIYDERGRLLKERSSEDGVEFTETVCRYDQQGNLIYEGSATDEKDGRYYQYDEQGSLIREWPASDEESYTSYQYEDIRVSKEQLEENGKFYMDDPQNMEIIKEQRGAE